MINAMMKRVEYLRMMSFMKCDAAVQHKKMDGASEMVVTYG